MNAYTGWPVCWDMLWRGRLVSCIDKITRLSQSNSWRINFIRPIRFPHFSTGKEVRRGWCQKGDKGKSVKLNDVTVLSRRPGLRPNSDTGAPVIAVWTSGASNTASYFMLRQSASIKGVYFVYFQLDIGQIATHDNATIYWKNLIRAR